jgi:hypothetical protein
MDRYTYYWNHHLWKDENGEYVLYEDHLAAIAEKDKEIERLKGRHKCNCPRCGGGSLDVYEQEDSDG